MTHENLSQRYPTWAVPITASGLQGKQPLAKEDKAGQGIRQIVSVTLGKGLALRAGPRGLRGALLLPTYFCVGFTADVEMWSGDGFTKCRMGATPFLW